jgi:hypothetical protein
MTLQDLGTIDYYKHDPKHSNKKLHVEIES